MSENEKAWDSWCEVCGQTRCECRKVQMGTEEDESNWGRAMYEKWNKELKEKQMSEDENKFTSDEMLAEFNEGYNSAKELFTKVNYMRLDPEDPVVKRLEKMLIEISSYCKALYGAK